MGAFEDYISGSWQGLKRGAQELPENIVNWAKPAAVDGIKSYDGALTGTDLPYYGDDEISAAREYFDRQSRSNTSRLVDLVGNIMPGAAASKAAPVAARAGETVLGAGPAFKQRVAETALDMAPEARAARAAEQGYNLDVYHGTRADFDAFDQSKSRHFGTHAGSPEAVDGVLSNHADPTGFRILPLKMRTENMLDVPDAGRWTPDHVRRFWFNPDGSPAAGANMPEAMSTEIRTAIDRGDFGGKPWNDFLRDTIQGHGFDSVRYDNVAEGGGHSYIALDPSQLRSRFAAFDPAQANSSDLLAAHANPLASLNELYRNREDQ